MSNGKRYVFYDTLNGEVLIHEARNSLEHLPTVERIIELYPILNERYLSSFDVLILDYDSYERDFIESKGYRVNLETKEIEFSYPDPNEPEKETVYVRPLSESVSEQMDYLVDVDFRLSMIELGM